MKKISVYVTDDDLQFLAGKTEQGFGPAIAIQAAIERLRRMGSAKCTKALMGAMALRKRTDKRRTACLKGS